MKIRIFHIPFPSRDVAVDVVASLLETRVIACGNIVASASLYEWDSELKAEDEWIAYLKTSLENKDKLEQAVKKLHPYDLPAIISWEVDVNDEYAIWVERQVNLNS